MKNPIKRLIENIKDKIVSDFVYDFNNGTYRHGASELYKQNYNSIKQTLTEEVVLSVIHDSLGRNKSWDYPLNYRSKQIVVDFILDNFDMYANDDRCRRQMTQKFILDYETKIRELKNIIEGLTGEKEPII